MENLTQVLVLPKNLVVIGLSDKADRPSYLVSSYMQSQGYKIIPVNPGLTEVLGEKSYPSLAAIPPELQWDIVDVFRQPEAVMAIVDEIIASGKKPIIWLQEGVIAPEAKTKAEANGLKVFMDVCIMKEHQAMSYMKQS